MKWFPAPGWYTGARPCSLVKRKREGTGSADSSGLISKHHTGICYDYAPLGLISSGLKFFPEPDGLHSRPGKGKIKRHSSGWGGPLPAPCPGPLHVDQGLLTARFHLDPVHFSSCPRKPD